MALGWKDWTKNDIIYGIILPLVVILVIVVFSQLGSILGYESSGIIIGITSEIEELLILVAIPLIFGLVWNRWAGGASGFLMGTLYALAFASKLPSSGFMRDAYMGLGPVMLGYVLSAMLIGYMAGALNKRSENFKRMALVGFVASTIGGVLLFGIYQLSPSNVVTGVTGFLLTVLARSATGVIIAVLAKVFLWYGLSVKHKADL
jgi:ACR3 family arsenite efflux pump ArsB